jgi:hypothetical protein
MKILLSSFVLSFTFFNFAKANEGIKEKKQEVVDDARRAAKNASRDIEDKTCRLIHGKMECAMKKAKHSIQKSADKIEDASD